jgi:hypothetical protein
MRAAINQVIFLLFLSSTHVLALDLTAYESQCAEIGFKRKTVAFGECVLELKSRESTTARASANSQGDGSADHSTCVRYGFGVGTTEYAQCRMQIDLAKSQAQEQQRQYERQVAEQQKAKDRAKGEAAFLMGLSMMAGGGQRQPGGNSFNNIPPPPAINQIYNLPGGKFMTCNTMGRVTNCQ